jgi:hypothetical protein
VRFYALIIVTRLLGHTDPRMSVGRCLVVTHAMLLMKRRSSDAQLGGDNGGPRDALHRRYIVGMHQVCVGFVVVVLVGEGVCIGLPCCGVVAGVRRFEGSFE